MSTWTEKRMRQESLLEAFHTQHENLSDQKKILQSLIENPRYTEDDMNRMLDSGISIPADFKPSVFFQGKEYSSLEEIDDVLSFVSFRIRKCIEAIETYKYKENPPQHMLNLFVKKQKLLEDALFSGGELFPDSISFQGKTYNREFLLEEKKSLDRSIRFLRDVLKS